MFEDGDHETKDQGFKINRKFEAKFNEKKKREDLERARAKYGKDFDRQIDGESDSSMAEDENAELDTEEVALKVLSTISKIRAKNPEIYEKEKKFFDENDFADSTKNLEKGTLGKRSEPLTYKKLISQRVAAGDLGEEDEDLPNEEDETPFELQQRIKNEFKNAANFEGREEAEDELFKVKKKSKQQILDEEEEFNRFLKTQKKKNKEEAKEIKKVWGNKAELDEGDRFLRSFILTKGWIEKSDDEAGEDYTHTVPVEKSEEFTFDRWRTQQPIADQEDEAREAEVDKFEEKINFRFEQKGGNKLQTFERDMADTMRQKDSTRADKRKERDERKKGELDHFKTEVEHLRNLKKEELNRKIKKLMEAGGLDLNTAEKTFNHLMQNDFEEDKFDKVMDNAFGDNYYEDEEEDDEELKRYVDEVDENVDKLILGEKPKEATDNQAQNKMDEEDIVMKPQSNVPILLKKKLNKEEAEGLKEGMKDNLWWYCDNCGRGIQPLESRFDCMECEDYTECKACADLKGHDHQMKKFVVPEGCAPPADDTIQEYLQEVKECSKCESKLDPSQIYYKNKEVEDYILCETCYYFSKKKKNRKLYERILPKTLSVQNLIENEDYHKLSEITDNPELVQMIDDYYKIDFEDVIAGGLKTRFKYVNVESNDFNLDDEDMLFADDKILNRYLSVKKLAPYRSEEISDKHKKRMKKLLSLVKGSTEKNKQEVVRRMELEKEEEYLKGMAKKNLKYKKKLEKFYEKKEKILKGQEERALIAERRENMRLTDMTNRDEPMAPEDTGISNNRLKSYNL